MTSDPNRRAPRSHARVHARRTAAVARFRGAPFTRTQALACGLSERDLRSSAVRRLERGVYVAPDVPLTPTLRCAGAALRLPPGGRIAGHSAARLLGLVVPAHDRIILSVPRGTRFSAEQHRVVTHDDEDAVSVWLPAFRQNVPVTAPRALLEECVDDLSLVDAVVLADMIARRAGRRAEDHLERWRRSAAQRVRHVADLVDAGAESPPETRLRVLLALAGFPPPATQYEVQVAGRMRRFDLAWPEYRVAVEYDGSYHYATERQKQADILRDEELRGAGWFVVRVVSVGIYRDPASTLERCRRALDSRGCFVTPRDEWRTHFPQVRNA